MNLLDAYIDATINELTKEISEKQYQINALKNKKYMIESTQKFNDVLSNLPEASHLITEELIEQGAMLIYETQNPLDDTLWINLNPKIQNEYKRKTYDTLRGNGYIPSTDLEINF